MYEPGAEHIVSQTPEHRAAQELALQDDGKRLTDDDLARLRYVVAVLIEVRMMTKIGTDRLPLVAHAVLSATGSQGAVNGLSATTKLLRDQQFVVRNAQKHIERAIFDAENRSFDDNTKISRNIALDVLKFYK